MQLQRKRGFYETYIKRLLDIVCALLALTVFGWLYVIIAIAIHRKLGSPVLFQQVRPGLIDPKTGKERIFTMYKFRTMSDERDADGNLLPDEQRLSRFGRKLRSLSLDELPEALNILKGDMSVIGPRPQLVRDMVFMSDEQRMRHTAKPGLSGLAQVSGRNALTWENKIACDLQYIEHVTFWNDVTIVLQTVKKVFGKGESHAELDVTLDYGDMLLKAGRISAEEYAARQVQAKKLLMEYEASK